MIPTALVPGTLCDQRIFGRLTENLADPAILAITAFENVITAAETLIGSVKPGSLGIAFSLGSWVLLEMMRIDPKRFSGILLISGNCYPDDADGARERRRRVEEGRRRGFAHLFATEWGKMLGPDCGSSAALRRLILEMAESVGHDAHARQAEMNITRPDCRRLAAQPTIPLHIVAGAHDGLCPLERYEATAAGDGSSLTIVADAGHYVPLEAPKAVHGLLRTHFRRALV